MYHNAFPDVKCTLQTSWPRVTGWHTVGALAVRTWESGRDIPPIGNHMTAKGITIYRIVGGRAVEGWSSEDISRSEEEQRWLSEGGRSSEAYLEGVANLPLDEASLHHSVANEALIRNLTWRFRAAEVREHERIEHELRLARQIQEELLPESTPTLERWQLAAHYKPAREVGGDFYDFLDLEDGRLGVVVGDATGHGIPAALMMSTTRGMLRAVVQTLERPGEVLGRVNEALVSDIPPSTFVTCFYGILDPQSGRLVYANAGHNLPSRRRHDGQADELRARGMPLGLMPGTGYEEKEVVLEPGDSTLFYSDGLVEAHNPQREMFGFPHLRRLVAEHDAEEGSLVEILMDELRSFTGEGWEQEDDITIVTLKRTTSPSSTVTVSGVSSEHRGAEPGRTYTLVDTSLRR